MRETETQDATLDHDWTPVHDRNELIPEPLRHKTSTLVDPLLRKPVVLKILSMSKSELHRQIKSGDFPKPVKTGKTAVAWRQSEIVRWVDTRPRAP